MLQLLLCFGLSDALTASMLWPLRCSNHFHALASQMLQPLPCSSPFSALATSMLWPLTYSSPFSAPTISMLWLLTCSSPFSAPAASVLWPLICSSLSFLGHLNALASQILQPFLLPSPLHALAAHFYLLKSFSHFYAPAAPNILQPQTFSSLNRSLAPVVLSSLVIQSHCAPAPIILQPQSFSGPNPLRDLIPWSSPYCALAPSIIQPPSCSSSPHSLPLVAQPCYSYTSLYSSPIRSPAPVIPQPSLQKKQPPKAGHLRAILDFMAIIVFGNRFWILT